MASMRDIKRRKESIQSTGQITKAMKLVSTVKLQKAKGKAESTKPYFDCMYDTIAQILKKAGDIDHEYLKNNPDTRSVACFTDNFALGAASWCSKNGLTVGKDIFLAGFNNIEAVRFYPHPISSAEHPVDESIEILLQEMDKNQPFNNDIKLKVILRS